MATEKLSAYLALTCPVVLEGGSSEEVRSSLSDPEAQRALVQFATDTQNVLCVRYAAAIDDTTIVDDGEGGAGGATSSPGQAGPAFTFSAEVTYVGEPLPTVVFIKNAPGPLDAAKRVGAQIQMITINSDTAAAEDAAEENKEAGGGGKDSKEAESKTVSDVGTGTLELFRGYISQVMAPMVRSYASARTGRESKETKASDEKVAAATGFANLTRKINELDVAFTHCQQNFQVPDVDLQPHPSVLEASQQCRTEGKVLSLSELGLEAKAKDPAFLNNLTNRVKKWIREIQKVTGLVRDPSLGNTMAEVNFWKSMDKSLESIKRQVESPFIELTFSILHQANKFGVRFGFDAGTSLTPRIEEVRNIMNLMKDFPIDALLTAPALGAIPPTLKSLLHHLNRIKTIEQYSYNRTVRLVQAISRDLTNKVTSLLGQRNVMKNSFSESNAALTEAILLLDDFQQDKRDFLSDLQHSKKRVSKRREKPLATKSMAHEPLLKRLQQFKALRADHDKLYSVIQNVLSKDESLGNSVKMLEQLDEAYTQLCEADVLDISESGTSKWADHMKWYQNKFDQVEATITTKLREVLGATQTANEMFRIFSKFNALLVRPRVKGAIQQFQQQLLDQVKADIDRLQQKFRSQFHGSEESKMSTLRDLPPVSGQIVWARQIERQLLSYLQRVEHVLGKGWANHPAGVELKDIGDKFRNKLDANKIFKLWWQNIQAKNKEGHNAFDYSQRILHVVKVMDARSERLELRVQFDAQIIKLFKEVRNLDHLGFGGNIPLAIRVESLQAKEKYPEAMSLQETLRTFHRCQASIRPQIAPLLAERMQGIQKTVEWAFKRSVCWEMDKNFLEEYVNKLHGTVMALHEQLGEVQERAADVQGHVDKLKTCPYSKAAFSEILGALQKTIDEMNLSSLSNLDFWVGQVNEDVSKVLLQRLNNEVQRWSEVFAVINDPAVLKTGPQSRAAKRLAAKVTKAIKDSGLPQVSHAIVLHSRVLQLDPPLQESRVEQHREFNSRLATILDLQRLQASRYDQAIDLGTGSGADSSASAAAAIFERRHKTYAALLEQLPQADLEQAYAAVESQLERVSEYVDQWLQYQALWDMDPTSMFARIGDDVDEWQHLLTGIRKSRATFDSAETFKRFGNIVINYAQVQEKVDSKYDAWHKDVLTRFSEIVGDAMRQFKAEITDLRAKLEETRLDGSTSDVIAFIKHIFDAKTKVPAWATKLESYGKGETLLRRNMFSFPSDWLWYTQVEGEWETLQQILERKDRSVQKEIPMLQKKIVGEEETAASRAASYARDWAEQKPLKGDVAPSAALDQLNIFDGRLTRLEDEMDEIRKAKVALQLDPPKDEALGPLREELRDLKMVWSELVGPWQKIDELKEIPWTSVVPRKVRRELDGLLNGLAELPNMVRQYEAYTHLQSCLRIWKKTNSTVTELRSDAIKDRHWRTIMKELRLGTTYQQLTLGKIWDCGLKKYSAFLEGVVREAQGEMALEQFLNEVKEFWNAYEFELVNYQNKCRLIRGWDDLFEKLDENLASLTSMQQSPYYKVFASEASSWDKQLSLLRLVLDVWIDVQRRWIYLEGIFLGSQDIKAQLPNEYSRFKSIDSEFVALMRKVSYKPRALDVLAIEGLQRTLEHVEDLLTKIQRALGEYLERQRAAFSRFYFVGDEDLLEIIGNSKEPQQIQRHLLKMFAGVATLIGEQENGVVKEKALGMTSREGEVVNFHSAVDIVGAAKVVDWLNDTEKAMQTSLATNLLNAIEAAVKWSGHIDAIVAPTAKGQKNEHRDTFINWMDTYCTQIVIMSTQIQWSSSVESAMAKDATALQQPLDRVVSLLKLLADRVLGDLPTGTRQKYEQLMTEMVHQRDVTRSLLADAVGSPEDFTWLYQMRYYFHTGEADLMKKLEVQVANATFHYGFEYLGVGNRLVQTPLTDRCYLTLTQALHNRLGGNPFGPAGTGKTESVKMLGSLFGRFVLVFNCDETFDFQAMGRIFRGLCQVGAWGCFDEFNRLEERILSAVSQQILAIQTGLLRGERQIELVGRQVTIDPNVGIFVTMNPGYAGRSNLPDNLKQLFRSIAMIKPDWELIAQVMLFSQGFRSAEALAGKIVLLFSLCAGQLSSQPHYDFGLRALKTVLVSSGTLKRQHLAEMEEDLDSISDAKLLEVEREVLLASVSETMVPKFVAQDIPLFNSILAGVYPGTEPHTINQPLLRQKIHEVCAERDFVPGPAWIEKTLQLFQILKLSHGVMMVGPTGSGKTSSRSVLLEAMHRCDGIVGRESVIDPKAISKDELYGTLDATTMEWKDGVFTHILRQVLNNVRGEDKMRHWITLDGDVDPEWIENLNSVLDDNKLLTLPSGERLAIPSNVRILFEVDTLKYATLATVSRCGMVFFSDDTLPLQDVLTNFLDSIYSNKVKPVADGAAAGDALAEQQVNSDKYESKFVEKASEEVVRAIRPLFAEFVPGVLAFALEQEHVMDTTRGRLLMTLKCAVYAGIQLVAEYNEGHSDFPLGASQVTRFAERWLVMSLIWAFGGSMDFRRRVELGRAIGSMSTIELPAGSDNGAMLVDYEVYVEDGEWHKWSDKVPQIEIESHQVLQTDVVIPTVDTVRHKSALRGWLAQHKPLILCGPPGSGKSMTLIATLSSLPELELVWLNFSSGTQPELVLKVFDQYCEFAKGPNGWTVAPKEQGKWLCIFCDEINLPATDAYNTQKVITFLRQLVERGGYWRCTKKMSPTWVRLERIQFVGACNPPTDPGRVPLAHRFLANAPVLLVDFPAPQSLRQIYGTFCRGLVKMQPDVRGLAGPLTEAMVDLYLRNQEKFSPDQHPHYIYSPRELSRWMRALYEAMRPLDSMNAEELVRLWAHEGLRLFNDRLVTQEEHDWCDAAINEVARAHFPSVDLDKALQRPILFSSWMSKFYESVDREELRAHVQARLKVFNEEELDVQLVVFDEVLDHVLRIDRVLRQPLGHLLLVGESGAGKTVLSRFVSWTNNLSVFQIKISRKYTIESFNADLRAVCKRAGCDGERICFIFDESNVLSSAFLENMNALLASGEVPGLFEGDEYTALMNDCRAMATREGKIVDTEDELYRLFTKNVQNNLHVVFTMNPASMEFENRAATSPALFNRCVVDWFGTWSPNALAQVAFDFTKNIDVGGSQYIATVAANDWADDNLACLPTDQLSQHVAVVASITNFHANVHAMVKMAAKTGRQTYLSPRDFLDFIRHYVSLEREKRSELEEQQRHLNVGLDKLNATAEEVEELRGSLAVKEKELEQKNREANDKLQLMVHDQNIAETKKSEAEKLSKELDQQNIDIAERQKVVQGDLDKAEPALIEARNAVSGIQKRHLDELRALNNPPAQVARTLGAVCTMLGHDQTEWRAVRRILASSDFIPSVVSFDTKKLKDTIRKKLQARFVNDETLTFESVNRGSRAAGPLYKWVVSQVGFAEILLRIKPLKNELAKLEQDAEEVKRTYEELQTTIVELEKSIATYKDEYAVLIRATEGIKVEMETVQTKCLRSGKLLEGLSEERTRWNAGSQGFKDQVATLVGDALLAGAFCAYVGFFDFKQRQLLVQDWADILQDYGIATKEDLSLSQYLSTPAQRLEWQSNKLPSDDLCVENAIILNRFNRYPLVVDPSGQATEFLVRQYEKQKISKTSFLDPGFMKHLEQAIRFGTTLLVQDVDNLDPVLNPVLNREYTKAGGRVLVRVGEQEIDCSPAFSIFLTTRDPTARFTPDLCSRVTFVNFTVTPSSLESQCLGTVLKNQRPDVDERRTKLLKLQGEYKARLRELEDHLLDALNSVKGGILDDDSVMNKLETLKTEARQVQAESDKSESVMLEVQASSKFFEPMARACSRLYFAMQDLASVHFLYHFSLQTFLGLLARALEEGKAGASADESDEQRLSRLLDRMFMLVVGRTQRALLEEDKVLFTLRAAQIRLDTSLALSLSPNGSGFDMSTTAPPSESSVIEHAFEVLTQAATQPPSMPAGVSRVQADFNLSAIQANELALLERLLPGAFGGAGSTADASDAMLADPDAWKALMEAAQPERGCAAFTNIGFPASAAQWTVKQTLVAAAVIKALRPDRLTAAVRQSLEATFGEDVLDFSIHLQNTVEGDSSARHPLLLVSSVGYDPSSKIDDLAFALKKKYTTVSMGSEEGYEQANRAIAGGAKAGSWVLLRNIHLCGEWLKGLEKRVFALNPSPSFRLFLTSEIHPAIPPNLCRLSQLLVFQPPAGVRASLLRSFATIPAARMEKAPAERSRLYLLLAWLNAIVAERRRYAPVGWTKPYEFSDADQKCALDAIDTWMDKVAAGRTHVDPLKIPWRALQTLLSQSIYGGRVDNKFDDTLLSSFVQALFVPESFDLKFSLVSGLTPGSGVDPNAEPGSATSIVAPEGTTKKQFMDWIHTLPSNNTPEWLGLPRTAETALLIAQGSALRQKFAGMQGQVDEAAGEAADAERKAAAKSGTGSSVAAWVQQLGSTAARWRDDYLPERVKEMDRSTGNVDSGIFRFFERECRIGQDLLSTVRGDIVAIEEVCAETIKPTNRLRSVMKSLNDGRIPGLEWGGRYTTPSVMLAASWVQDLGRRLTQLVSLTDNKTTPLSQMDWARQGVWLGGLFSPKAFITATRQETAAQLKCSVQELRLQVTLGGESEETLRAKPAGSFCVEGLSLEGAQWDAEAGTLAVGGADNFVSVDIPKSSFRWVPESQLPSRGDRELLVPLYANNERSDVLVTIKLGIPEGKPPAFWHPRAVALIAWSQ